MIARLSTLSSVTSIAVGTRTIFTVTGIIRNVFLFARVTTVLGAGATSVRVAVNPTTGATDSDLCVDTVITTATAGSLYGLTGVPTDQLQKGAGEGLAPYGTNPIALTAGVVQIIVTGGPASGAVEWYMSWDPASSDAAVV
jgi:hypothetical protein